MLRMWFWSFSCFERRNLWVTAASKLLIRLTAHGFWATLILSELCPKVVFLRGGFGKSDNLPPCRWLIVDISSGRIPGINCSIIIQKFVCRVMSNGVHRILRESRRGDAFTSRYRFVPLAPEPCHSVASNTSAPHCCTCTPQVFLLRDLVSPYLRLLLMIL